MIYVYNKKIDDFSCEKNHYEIGRPNILQNPYTELPIKKTIAQFQVASREEALAKYSHYFDIMYGSNCIFTKVVDEIYEKYKNGEDVYLACWCKKHSVGSAAYKSDSEIVCHGDVIVEKLRKRLIREKMKKLTNK